MILSYSLHLNLLVILAFYIFSEITCFLCPMHLSLSPPPPLLISCAHLFRLLFRVLKDN
jgi:hypothetical protein